MAQEEPLQVPSAKYKIPARMLHAFQNRRSTQYDSLFDA